MAAPLLAPPLFTDLTKACRDVLHGSPTGEGAFAAAAGASIKAQSTTADGVVVSASTQLLSSAGHASPQLMLAGSPLGKGVLLVGIVDAARNLTGSATLSGLLGHPGLTATVSATRSAGGSLTLDFTQAAARVRALLSPSDPSDALRSLARPALQLSATATLGPCVVGGSVGADTASGRLTSWAAGINYTRLVRAAVDDGGGGGSSSAAAASDVASLNGQQWGLTVQDAGGGGGTTATITAHQLLQGGRVDVAAEYRLPVHIAQQPGIAGMHPLAGAAAAGEAHELTLGVSRRLERGGLVKARLSHSGGLALLYQSSVSGLGQASVSVSLDPLRLSKAAPTVGLSVTL